MSEITDTRTGGTLIVSPDARRLAPVDGDRVGVSGRSGSISAVQIAAPPGKSRPASIVAIVALAAIVTATASCRGSGPATTGRPSAGDRPEAVLPITLSPPAGWSHRADGTDAQVIALNAADLAADAPAGPRISVTHPSAPLPEIADVARMVEEAPSGNGGMRIVHGPGSVTVAGEEVPSITVEETLGAKRITTRYVVVNRGDGQVFEFRLQAPSDLWEEHADALAEAIAGATFAP